MCMQLKNDASQRLRISAVQAREDTVQRTGAHSIWDAGIVSHFRLEEVLHEHDVSVARSLDAWLVVHVLLHNHQTTRPYTTKPRRYGISLRNKSHHNTDFRGWIRDLGRRFVTGLGNGSPHIPRGKALVGTWGTKPPEADDLVQIML